MPNTVSAVHGALPPPLGLRAGDAQVLAHGEALEDAAALRHQRDAARGDRSGGSRVMSAPNTSTAPRARRQQADGDVHAGRLAGAVAAEQAEQAAFAERERHLLQDVAVPVEGVDVAEAERA